MTIEEAVRTRLLAYSAMTDLVGPRVYVQRLPQAPQYPAVVIHRIAGPRDHSQSGPTNLVRSRLQIDCYGQTISAAKRAAQAARKAVDGQVGVWGTVEIQAVFADDEFDGLEDRLDVASASIDITLYHSDA